MSKIIKMQPYEVVEFDWGTAMKHRNGEWDKVFLKPDAKEIDVSKLNVILHNNGIEFL